MNKVPCLHCEHRDLTCHMGCEKYLQYRKIIDNAKESKVYENNIINYEICNIYKMKRARNLPQYR